MYYNLEYTTVWNKKRKVLYIECKYYIIIKIYRHLNALQSEIWIPHLAPIQLRGT